MNGSDDIRKCLDLNPSYQFVLFVQLDLTFRAEVISNAVCLMFFLFLNTLVETSNQGLFVTSTGYCRCKRHSVILTCKLSSTLQHKYQYVDMSQTCHSLSLCYTAINLSIVRR